MLENKIDELFITIKDSKEYLDYIKIKDKLDKDEEIKELIAEIKKLEQKATLLEYNNDPKYLEIDEITSQKVAKLNENKINKVYQEYLQTMKKLNEVLATSSKMIEEYINDKI